MKKIAIAASLAALFWAAPAFADSAFQGFHVGASVGPESGKFSVAPTGGTGNATDLGPSGFTYGADIGYMFSFSGNWVFDIQGIINSSSVTANTGLPAPGPTSIKQGIGYGAAGSIGYMLNQQTMVYAKLGYMLTDFTIDGGTKKSDGGILLGLGARFALTSNWGVKAEYDYTTYKKYTDATVGADVTPITNVFLVGVDYRF